MGDNPFAEPDDSDRTIIRPLQGARPAAPKPEAAEGEATQVARPAAAPPAAFSGQIAMGGSALLNAAAPLLQLLARLRNTVNQPDGGNLRARATHELRRFEQVARDALVPMEQLRPAHYALCASLDDVVLATPWGSQSGWAAQSLVSTFHQEVRSGERFFDLLDQLKKTPGSFLPALELMYFCLSLGYMGRYRLSPRGPAEIDHLREDLYALIRRVDAAPEAGLSVRWAGVDAPYRPRRFRVPAWVVGAAALAILSLAYATFRFDLSGGSDAVFQAAAAAAPAQMPKIVRAAPVVAPAEPVAPEPTILDRLRAFLAPEIAARKVSVLGTISAPVIRINNQGLFASGRADVESGAIPLLGKIGAALTREKGLVTITGYTDNRPIHTLQFPSNFTLSTARARSAAAILDRSIGDQSRLSAKGLGDADPVASNATAAGRAENRRIEIVLQHSVQN